MGTVRYFWHGFIHWGTTFMYLQYSRAPYFSSFAVHHQCVHLCWCSVLTAYSTDKFISCVVPGPSQWFFNFGEEIIIAWTWEKTTTLGDTEPYHSWQCKESHRCCQGLLLRSKWKILEHPPYTPDMSSCYDDLFAKVKKPLRGNRYNTRDEIIRAIGGQYRTSIKMDTLMVYDASQTFDKEWLIKGRLYRKYISYMLYPCESCHVRNIELLPLSYFSLNPWIFYLFRYKNPNKKNYRIKTIRP